MTTTSTATEPTTKADRSEAEAADRSARLAFDDSDEGERLRRYQISCGRSLNRSLDMLLKLRKAEEKRQTVLVPTTDTVATRPGQFPVDGECDSTPGGSPAAPSSTPATPFGAPDHARVAGVQPGGRCPQECPWKPALSPTSSPVSLHRGPTTPVFPEVSRPIDKLPIPEAQSDLTDEEPSSGEMSRSSTDSNESPDRCPAPSTTEDRITRNEPTRPP